MKKKICVWLAMLVACFMFVACGASQGDNVVKITFKQNGQEDIIKTIDAGETLTDIPMPSPKVGYTIYWDKNDFINVKKDMTVMAIEEAKTYTVILESNGGSVSPITMSVTYGQSYALPTPTHPNKEFKSWQYNSANISAIGVWNIDEEDGEINIVVLWGTKNEFSDNF